MPLCAEDSSASRAMSWALAESCSVAEASVVELSPIAVMTARMLRHRGLERGGHPADLVPAVDAGRAAQVAVGQCRPATAPTRRSGPDDGAGDDPAEQASTRTPAAGDDEREGDGGAALLRASARRPRSAVGGDGVAERAAARPRARRRPRRTAGRRRGPPRGRAGRRRRSARPRRGRPRPPGSTSSTAASTSGLRSSATTSARMPRKLVEWSARSATARRGRAAPCPPLTSAWSTSPRTASCIMSAEQPSSVPSALASSSSARLAGALERLHRDDGEDRQRQRADADEGGELHAERTVGPERARHRGLQGGGRGGRRHR